MILLLLRQNYKATVKENVSTHVCRKIYFLLFISHISLLKICSRFSKGEVDKFSGNTSKN